MGAAPEAREIFSDATFRAAVREEVERALAERGQQTVFKRAAASAKEALAEENK